MQTLPQLYLRDTSQGILGRTDMLTWKLTYKFFHPSDAAKDFAGECQTQAMSEAEARRKLLRTTSLGNLEITSVTQVSD